MTHEQDDVSFTPETMRSAAEAVENLRFHYLFHLDEAGACPFAEQYYLLALNALEQAQRHFQQAGLSQSRAIGRPT